MLSSATVVPGERTIVFVQKKATATWLKRELRYSLCLLYWYKSTNTDAARRSAKSGCVVTIFMAIARRYSVYLLY